MSHLAAFVPSPKAPIEVKETETIQPGSNELLVKNELIALNPIEAKLAKHAVFPLQYPAILGISYGGTVIAVGDKVTGFKTGDKVAAYRYGSPGNAYSSYQKLVLVKDTTATKLPDGIDLSVPVSLTGNLTTIVGLLSGGAGVTKPDLDSPPPSTGKKILVYGGTSSVGSLAVQYATQAGYAAVTTTSPKHADFVSKLGAVRVFDHTQDADALVKQLTAEGPYDIVLDSISIPSTIKITGQVLAAQGGGKIYALLPAYGPEDLPPGVTREFASWTNLLGEKENAGLLEWAFNTYLPRGVSSGKIVPHPTEKVSGGLEGLNDALSRLDKGVSGVKLVIDPQQ